MSKIIFHKGNFPYRIDHKARMGKSPWEQRIFPHKYLLQLLLIRSGGYFWPFQARVFNS